MIKPLITSELCVLPVFVLPGAGSVIVTVVLLLLCMFVSLLELLCVFVGLTGAAEFVAVLLPVVFVVLVTISELVLLPVVLHHSRATATRVAIGIILYSNFKRWICIDTNCAECSSANAAGS